MSSTNYTSPHPMETIQATLTQIFIPYIIIVSSVGIAGNVLTIIMLSKRTLTKNFNNCTLIALGVADLLFNLALVSFCINKLSGWNSNGFCRFLSFLSHLAELLSACFTAHFTIQRFIAVRFPLSVFMEKNVHLLHYVIESVIVLSGVTYCLMLIKKNSYERCQEELKLNWFISDALLSFVIPFTIIATLNLLIIVRLRKASRKNQQLPVNSKRPKRELVPLSEPRHRSFSCELNFHSRSSEPTSASTGKSSPYQCTPTGRPTSRSLGVRSRSGHAASIRSTMRSHAQSHRVTRMLILVSTCFLLLNAPWHICTVSLKIYTSRAPSLPVNVAWNETAGDNLSLLFSTTAATPHRSSSPNRLKFMLFQIFYIILIVSQHISYLSYSINFFLYSFCGVKFRRELVKVLSRCLNYRGQLSASSTNVSGPHLL